MPKRLLILALIFSLLTACSGQGPKQTGGGLLGGAAGALLGAQFGKGSGKLFGVAIGALAGSYLGGNIGHQLDQKDKSLARETMGSSLENAPDHQSRAWRNPNNNHSGEFEVTKTEELPEENLVCRDYVHTVTLDGAQEKVHGRACRDVRDPKAQWRVQS